MFSSLFGKRRTSPEEDDAPPPIPGPQTDDGFEILNPASSRGGLYPNVGGTGAPGLPYPLRPAPPAPVPSFRQNMDQTFHYLQGVPFAMSKELQMASRKDSLTNEMGNILAFLTTKVNMSGYEYDFTTERSVLKEC